MNLLGAFKKTYSLLILLALWEILTRSYLISPELLPPFSSTLATLGSILISGELLTHTKASLFRLLIGLVVAIGIGVPLGMAIGWQRRAEEFFNPLLTMIYPMPKPALIPLFMLWLGIGDLSKITIIVMGCLIPIVITAQHGAKTVSRQVIWSARSMGAKERRLLFNVVLPASLPHLLSGIRIAVAVSFLLVVSSEMIAAKSGLGYLIFLSMEVGNYRVMLASTLTVTFLGFIFTALFDWWIKRILVWHHTPEERRSA